MSQIYEAGELFNKRAQEYQEKFMDTSLYHQTFDIFCDNITTEQPHVLELACGPGNITQYLVRKRPDFHILATDIAPNMLELAKANNSSVETRLLDCRKLNELPEKFDGIMCGFVLPYLSKKESFQFISDAARQLNTGGTLYISTMEGGYEMSGIQSNSYGDEVYMYYHEAEYLTDELKKNGFTIINLQRVDCPWPTGVISRDLILISSKD